MKIVKKLALLVSLTIGLIACKDIQKDVDNVLVTLSVSKQSGDENNAKGWPVYMHLKIGGTQPSTSLYVHVFQRISNGEYYYQSSAAVSVNAEYDLPAYLGTLSDINRDYEVYAIVNDDKDYPKDSDGIYRVNSLPKYQKAGILVRRVR